MSTLDERPELRWARLNGKEPRMNPTAIDGSTPAKEMLADLYRLIEALDRRVPRLDRLGEAQIARDASNLRERAARLIHQIETLVQSTSAVSE